MKFDKPLGRFYNHRFSLIASGARSRRGSQFHDVEEVSMDFSGRFSEGLSFDDVLLRPARSNVLPREADLSTRFTRNIPINVPLLIAGMDTVTEARLAIAIAQQGGVGVIHK